MAGKLSRDILFRGKSLVTGDLVCGSLLADTADSTKDKDCAERHDGTCTSIFAWVDDLREYDEFPVDPATVAQYTGIRDRNGTRIFENDRIRCYYDRNGTEHFITADVCWDNKRAMFVLKTDQGVTGYFDMPDSYEVDKTIR